ncbi:GIY-YIG nuclease family protein [Pseudokineococcus basanitobsidens]|uniref:GIY-YIG nuclease family protein n=1 Tax=Pseudokineococcus basanitobsidens TaxID=1926649 RepID=A0ABU8RN82_9ACTN
MALQAARSVRTLRKRTTDPVVVDHLESVLDDLRGRADNEDAVAAEDVEPKAASEELSKTLAAASGVYVYTYPHYWRHPYSTGSERRLLKVGRTGSKAWNRVLSQARRTGMPEDPVLLRVYETDDPATVEHHFHVLLDAAEHQRSQGVAVGTEWFVTTIDFCDAVAEVLGLPTLKASGIETA